MVQLVHSCFDSKSVVMPATQHASFDAAHLVSLQAQLIEGTAKAKSAGQIQG